MTRSEEPGDLEGSRRSRDEPGARLFVGRDRQLDMMLRALDDAVSGRGRVVLLGGEPGIGKTRLAEEFAGQAAALDADVVWGRSWEAGGAPAYWPWTESLRTLFEIQRHAAGARPLEIDPHIAQLLPEMRSRVTTPPEVASGSPESARFELFVAVSSLLQRASQRRPLIVILEDLHAADAPSLLLLRFVARRQRAADSDPRDLSRCRTLKRPSAHDHTARTPPCSGSNPVSLPGLAEGDVARLMRTIPQLHAPA